MFRDSQHGYESTCVSHYLFKYPFNYQNVGVSWRDGSAGKGLAAQASEREGHPKDPLKKARHDHAYNPCAGRQKQKDPHWPASLSQ